MIDFNSDGGRIGSFWWLNASTAKTELHNAIYNGSLHYVWREGVCGWGSCIKPFYWRTIK